VAELPLYSGDISGLLDEVPAHGMPASWGVCPSTPARLHTSLNTVLITLGLRRPSPWALAAGERNSADDFHFLKKDRVRIAFFDLNY
jgi:hypothetical protein